MAIVGISVMEKRSIRDHQRTVSEGQVLARSPAMRNILAALSKIANTPIPVLLQGEIGVGKMAIAREIHRHSPFNTGPFVRVACATLAVSELREILFAESEGYLGVDTDGAAGHLGASQVGTLFLDGIADLPPWAQVKLLDLLQSSSRTPKGGVIGPRVIASSTCDLETAVVEDHFNSRLYYYLNAVRIDVPPLRHRQEDILLLAEHFLAAAVPMLDSSQNQLPWRFSAEARQSLLKFDWPGNVLQLAAVVAQAAMLAEGPEIRLDSVAGLLGRVRPNRDSEMISVPLGGGLREIELKVIEEVVRRCGGNKAAAARALGLHRRTLYRLMEE